MYLSAACFTSLKLNIYFVQSVSIYGIPLYLLNKIFICDLFFKHFHWNILEEFNINIIQLFKFNYYLDALCISGQDICPDF